MKVREASREEVAKPKRGRPPKTAVRGWNVPLAHPSYSIEQCPNCEFPEADGGYCENCGWSLPHPLGNRR